MATAWADGASGTIDAVPAQISSGATPTIGSTYAVGKRVASAVAREEIAAIGREEAGTGQQLGVDNSWNPKRKIPMSIQAKSGVHRSTIWRRVQKLLSLGWSVEDAKKAAMKGVTIVVGDKRKRHRIAHSSDEDEEDYEDEDNVEGMDNDEDEDDDEDAHETEEQAAAAMAERAGEDTSSEAEAPAPSASNRRVVSVPVCNPASDDGEDSNDEPMELTRRRGGRAPRYIELQRQREKEEEEDNALQVLVNGEAAGVLNLLRCAVCLEVLEKTVAAPCLHRFCQACVERWLRVGRHDCPECKMHIHSRRSFKRDGRMDELIGKLIDNGKLEPGSDAAKADQSASTVRQPMTMQDGVNERLNVSSAYINKAVPTKGKPRGKAAQMLKAAARKAAEEEAAAEGADGAAKAVEHTETPAPNDESREGTEGGMGNEQDDQRGVSTMPTSVANSDSTGSQGMDDKEREADEGKGEGEGETDANKDEETSAKDGGNGPGSDHGKDGAEGKESKEGEHEAVSDEANTGNSD